MFLVDSSGSVGRDNFARLLDFVNRVVDEMNIAYNHTRVGLVSFSNRAWISFTLDKYVKTTSFTHDMMHEEPNCKLRYRV